jgi:hypothetical protein
MKTLKTMLVATVLVAGITAASAQGTTRQLDEQAGGNSQSSGIPAAQLAIPRRILRRVPERRASQRGTIDRPGTGQCEKLLGTSTSSPSGRAVTGKTRAQRVAGTRSQSPHIRAD